MKIGLFIKHGVLSQEDEQHILASIIKSGHTLDNDEPEVVFTVGGDGTFLKAVQKYLDNIDDIKFLCINKGTLGFFSDFELDDFASLLPRLNELKYSSHRLIEAKIGNRSVTAVNEIRIENPFHTMVSDIYLNNNVFFEKVRGNGVVISTSNGSTGYNKSIGGSVIDGSIDVLQLKEVAPINNTLYSSLGSPLILNGNNEIIIKGDFDGAVIGYDHLSKSDIEVSVIRVRLSEKRVNIIHKDDYSYITKLSSKFIKG